MNTNSRCHAFRALPAHVHARLALLPRPLGQTQASSQFLQTTSAARVGQEDGTRKGSGRAGTSELRNCHHSFTPSVPRDDTTAGTAAGGRGTCGRWGIPPTVLTSTGPHQHQLQATASWQALIYNKTQQTSSTCSS